MRSWNFVHLENGNVYVSTVCCQRCAGASSLKLGVSLLFFFFFKLRSIQEKINTGWWGILRQWTTKGEVCLKETMAFKYRLFQPYDSLHFFTTCPNPESKCKKQRPNHRARSVSLHCASSSSRWDEHEDKKAFQNQLLGLLSCKFLSGAWRVFFFFQTVIWQKWIRT